MSAPPPSHEFLRLTWTGKGRPDDFFDPANYDPPRRPAEGDVIYSAGHVAAYVGPAVTVRFRPREVEADEPITVGGG